LGGEKDKNNAETIAAANPTAVNLAGRLPLSDLIALISRLNFFLGMDTGPTHLAAAFNVPVVMLFLNPIAKPARWGPWLTRHLTVCAKNRVQTIPIDEVLTAVKTVTAGGGVTDLEESRRLWLEQSR
jgi:ADP-heptose:LPS heptosyltransferase